VLTAVLRVSVLAVMIFATLVNTQTHRRTAFDQLYY